VTLKQRSATLIGVISGLIAAVSVLPLFEVCSDNGICGIFLVFAFPGMLLSMGASGNIHAFSRWLVVLFNWIFYALLFMGLRKLIRKFRGN
jgi:hypothetical protein